MMSYGIEDELCSQSPFSSGVVDDEETLLRTVYEPEHIVAGRVIESAISLTDLGQEGFSVDRHRIVIPDILTGRAVSQMANRPEARQHYRVACFPCGAVRRHRDDANQQAFIVIDTADQVDPAHASIFSAVKRGRGQLRKLRAQLLPLLQLHYDLADIFVTRPFGEAACP